MSWRVWGGLAKGTMAKRRSEIYLYLMIKVQQSRGDLVSIEQAKTVEKQLPERQGEKKRDVKVGVGESRRAYFCDKTSRNSAHLDIEQEKIEQEKTMGKQLRSGRVEKEGIRGWGERGRIEETGHYRTLHLEQEYNGTDLTIHLQKRSKRTRQSKMSLDQRRERTCKEYYRGYQWMNLLKLIYGILTW